MKENIKEDIKRISNLIGYIENADYVDASQCFDAEDIQAIEHILSDYKRVLKENERYQKSDYETICLENKELKEINERLESENQEFLYKYGNVLKENKEVKENCKKCIIRDELDEYVNNSIPIKKVKDKIEELKKKVEELTDDKGYWGGSDLLEQIKVLQELLESEERK